MFKFFKKANKLAILSFFFAIIFSLIMKSIDGLMDFFGYSVVILFLSPFLAVIFGILALISIALKYRINREFNRKMRTEIILSILGIFIGGIGSLMVIIMIGLSSSL